MSKISLTALSPLDGRYQGKCKALHTIASEYGLHYYRLVIEIKWLLCLSNHEQIQEVPNFSVQAKTLLNQLIENYNEQSAKRISTIETTTNHDVKAVEYYIKENLNHPELIAVKEFIHFACTSEDINNLAYGLMLKDIKNKVLVPQLSLICEALDFFIQNYATIPMLARTHGQAASPTTLGKEIANVKARIQRQMAYFQKSEILGKINGAVGNFNAHSVAYPEVQWEMVAKNFVEELGLVYNPLTTQIEPHDAMAEYFHCLIRINTIFIDLCRDIWGYIALGYFKQKMIANEVGSSTMPHKVNPIDFENAEGNFGLANAIFTHFTEKLPISRWQRDLSDSTVLRNIGVACGYMLVGIKSLQKGITKLEVNVSQLEKDLNDNWEILSEPIQTVMRRFGINEPYEKLKTLTRGQKITQEILHKFVNSLDLPLEVKQQLFALTPSKYIGLADKLIENLEEI